jgi:ribosomal protein S18 acetylase RimI-like enzyme
MHEFYKENMNFRALSRGDLIWFLNVRNSARMFLHNQTEFTIAQTQQWFDSGCSGNMYYIVDNGNQDIGYVRISNTDTAVTLIGLDISEDFRGLGFAKEIYKTFVRQFTPSLVKETVGLRVLKTNQRALNLYHSLGFAVIEETSDDFYMEIKQAHLAL